MRCAVGTSARLLAVLAAACSMGAAAASGALETQTGPCAPNWRIVPTAPAGRGSLTAVAALSSRDVWAVGGAEQGPPLVERWDGTRWNVVPSPAVRRGMLVDVAAVSATSVWAVGWIDTSASTANRPPKPLVEYWNGRRWAVVPTPASTWPSSVDAVSALSASDVWTLGDRWDHGPLFDHWDGRQWISVSGPHAKTSFLDDVAAISKRDAWAVGYWEDGLLTAHWNGRQWRAFKGPAVGEQGSALHSVAALSSSDVWAVGEIDNSFDLYEPLLYHWNGNRWSEVTGAL